MKKKRYGIILALLAALIFTGCQTKRAEKPAKTNLELAKEKAEAVLEAKVIKKQKDAYLIVNREEDGKAAELYTMKSEEELTEGELVNIYYNGIILESYPCQLPEIYAIEKVGKEDCLVSLYLDIFQELYEEDSGLNSDIKEIGVNVKNVKNLTEMEKEALIYLIGRAWNLEAFATDYEALKAEGRLSEDGYYYEEGILFTVEATEEEKNSFSFSAEKWRSGLGAIGYSNGRAKKENGKWSYEPGDFWIS